MANTYTVTVTVECVADSDMEAHGIILLTLCACKFTELLVQGPLVTANVVPLEPECTCRAKPNMACPVHGAECVEGGWED